MAEHSTKGTATAPRAAAAVLAKAGQEGLEAEAPAAARSKSKTPAAEDDGGGETVVVGAASGAVAAEADRMALRVKEGTSK